MSRRRLLPCVAAGLASMAALGGVAADTSCRNVAIRSPFRGETVSGTVPVLGSARIEGFSFYKVEWASASAPATWSAVSTTMPDPVVNGLLDQWDTRRLPDGRYILKLTVVDDASQEACRVSVADISIANAATASATPTTAALAPPTTAPVVGRAATEQPAPPEDTSAADEQPAEAPAEATLAPIEPAEAPDAGAGAGTADMAKALLSSEWAEAFLRGFLAALLVAALAVAIYARRRAP